MFLHLGSDTAVSLDDVIFIGDCRSLPVPVKTAFFENANERQVANIAMKSPKSYIVTKDKVYLSAIASITLKKRAENIFYE